MTLDRHDLLTAPNTDTAQLLHILLEHFLCVLPLPGKVKLYKDLIDRWSVYTSRPYSRFDLTWLCLSQWQYQDSLNKGEEGHNAGKNYSGEKGNTGCECFSSGGRHITSDNVHYPNVHVLILIIFVIDNSGVFYSIHHYYPGFSMVPITELEHF